MSSATPTRAAVAAVRSERIDSLLKEYDSPQADWGDAVTHNERQKLIAAKRQRDEIRSVLWAGRQRLATCSTTIARLEGERQEAHDALDVFETEAAREVPRGGMEQLRVLDVVAAYRAAIDYLRTGRCVGTSPPGAVVAYAREHHLDRLRPLSIVETELASARAEREELEQRIDATLAMGEAELAATE